MRASLRAALAPRAAVLAVRARRAAPPQRRQRQRRRHVAPRPATHAINHRTHTHHELDRYRTHNYGVIHKLRRMLGRGGGGEGLTKCHMCDKM